MGLQQTLQSAKDTLKERVKFDPSMPLEQKQQLYELLVEEAQDKDQNPLKYFDWKAVKGQKAFIYDPTYEVWDFSGKGRGKTTELVVKAILHLTGEYPSDYPEEGKMRQPVKGRLVSASIEKILLPELEKWMPKRFLKGGSIYASYNQKTHILNLLNGSACDLMSWDQELIAHKGANRHFVGYDEHGNKGKYEESKARVRGVGFRQIFGVLTPDEEQKGREALWEVDELFEKQFSREDLTIHRGYTGDNPFLSENYIKHLTENRSEDEIRILLYGEPLELVGLLYQLDKKIHIVDPIELYPDDCIWECIDPHPSAKTAVTWIRMNAAKEETVFEELHIDAIVKDICSAMFDVRAKYAQEFGHKMRVIKTLMDPTQINITNIQTKSKLADDFYSYGIVVHPANNDIDIGVNRIREHLQISKLTGRPRLTFTKNCRETIYSITHMSRDLRKNDKIKCLSDCVRYTLMDSPYYRPLKGGYVAKDTRNRSPLFRNV